MTHKAQGKPLFSLLESYRIVYLALRTVPHMMRGEKTGVLSAALRERLMMAVTEVNGCAMCSYYHAQMALEMGMDGEEIRRMLNGELRDVPEEEMTAVLFAQHYADTRGKPDAAAWDKLRAAYGQPAALAMLGAIRGIMMGNAYGIPAGSLLQRLGVKRFQTDSRSTPWYEISILLSAVVFLPAALLHTLIARVLRLPVTP